jgi:hypothetical protein
VMEIPNWLPNHKIRKNASCWGGLFMTSTSFMPASMRVARG